MLRRWRIGTLRNPKVVDSKLRTRRMQIKFAAKRPAERIAPISRVPFMIEKGTVVFI